MFYHVLLKAMMYFKNPDAGNVGASDSNDGPSLSASASSALARLDEAWNELNGDDGNDADEDLDARNCDCWHCVDRRSREAEERERAAGRSEGRRFHRPPPDGARLDPDLRYRYNTSSNDVDVNFGPRLLARASSLRTSSASNRREDDDDDEHDTRASAALLSAIDRDLDRASYRRVTAPPPRPTSTTSGSFIRPRARRSGSEVLEEQSWTNTLETELEEAAGFVNPFELLMMRQSARRDVLEAMFQNVVRQLVLTNDGDPTGGAGGVLGSAPLLHEDVDRLQVIDTESVAEPNESCPICLARYSEDKTPQVTKLPCKHFFHSNCIREWLTSRARTCPVCRHILQPSSFSRSEASADGASAGPAGNADSDDGGARIPTTTTDSGAIPGLVNDDDASGSRNNHSADGDVPVSLSGPENIIPQFLHALAHEDDDDDDDTDEGIGVGRAAIGSNDATRRRFHRDEEDEEDEVIANMAEFAYDDDFLMQLPAIVPTHDDDEDDGLEHFPSLLAVDSDYDEEFWRMDPGEGRESSPPENDGPRSSSGRRDVGDDDNDDGGWLERNIGAIGSDDDDDDDNGHNDGDNVEGPTPIEGVMPFYGFTDTDGDNDQQRGSVVAGLDNLRRLWNVAFEDSLDLGTTTTTTGAAPDESHDVREDLHSSSP